MALTLTCDCGVTVRGETEDDFVAKVQQHGREAHGMDVTREQALAMGPAGVNGMSAGIVGICIRLAAVGLGVALVGIVGAAPASAAASPNASCVGQIVSAAAPATVPFGANVVIVQVAASDHQFGQTVASVTAAQPRDACQQP